MTYQIKIYGMKQWSFPYDRFVEYEKTDEGWAKSIGFGELAECEWTIPQGRIHEMKMDTSKGILETKIRWNSV